MTRPFTILMNLLHAQATLTGTGHYSRHLAGALARLAEAPRVIGVCSPFNVDSFRVADAPNYEQLVWGHPWKRVGLRRLEEWARLDRLIARAGADVFFGPSNFLPWRKRGRMVVTIHDMTFFEYPEFLPPVRRWYWHQWTRRTIRVADAILTVSESAKQDIVRHGHVDPDRITVVHNGAAAAFFVGEDATGRAPRRAALAKRIPNLPARYVFFMGTLTSHKNVPRLVEAVARARARPGCENMQLVAAGKRGSGYGDVAEAIARHGLGGAVHELGYVEDEFLPALYESARAHVLPSFTEGFGLPIVEAMAAGTPVVTTNSGAMAEVGGDAAVLVDPRDADAMADALHRLWADDAFHAERRAAGLARARNFTWEEAARKTFAVLRGEGVPS